MSILCFDWLRTICSLRALIGLGPRGASVCDMGERTTGLFSSCSGKGFKRMRSAHFILHPHGNDSYRLQTPDAKPSPAPPSRLANQKYPQLLVYSDLPKLGTGGKRDQIQFGISV